MKSSYQHMHLSWLALWIGLQDTFTESSCFAKPKSIIFEMLRVKFSESILFFLGQKWCNRLWASVFSKTVRWCWCNWCWMLARVIPFFKVLPFWLNCVNSQNYRTLILRTKVTYLSRLLSTSASAPSPMLISKYSQRWPDCGLLFNDLV